jgi:hypothetical protein
VARLLPCALSKDPLDASSGEDINELIRNGSHESCSERSTEGSSQLAADPRKNLASCAPGILMRRNLMIWNTAIYWALVARDTVMVSLRCTLV